MTHLFQANNERGRPVRDLRPHEIMVLRMLWRMAAGADEAFHDYLVHLTDDRVDQSHIGEVLGLKRNAVHMKIARWRALAPPEERVV